MIIGDDSFHSSYIITQFFVIRLRCLSEIHVHLVTDVRFSREWQSRFLSTPFVWRTTFDFHSIITRWTFERVVCTTLFGNLTIHRLTSIVGTMTQLTRRQIRRNIRRNSFFWRNKFNIETRLDAVVRKSKLAPLKAIAYPRLRSRIPSTWSSFALKKDSESLSSIIISIEPIWAGLIANRRETVAAITIVRRETAIQWGRRWRKKSSRASGFFLDPSGRDRDHRKAISTVSSARGEPRF